MLFGLGSIVVVNVCKLGLGAHDQESQGGMSQATEGVRYTHVAAGSTMRNAAGTLEQHDKGSLQICYPEVGSCLISGLRTLH